MTEAEREKESTDVLKPIDRHLQSLHTGIKGAFQLLGRRDAECDALTKRIAELTVGLRRIADHDGDGMLVVLPGDKTGPSGMLSAAALARTLIGTSDHDLDEHPEGTD